MKIENSIMIGAISSTARYIWGKGLGEYEWQR
jgi:hypothetical protein